MEEQLNSVNAEQAVVVEQPIEQTTGIDTNVSTESTVETSDNGENAVVAGQQQNDKPIQDAETNAAYAKARRELEAKAAERESKAIDAFIASQGLEFDGKPIKTKAEYDKAMQIQEDRARQQELKEKGIDPEIFDDYVNNNPTVKKAQQLLAEQEAKAERDKQFMAFNEAFPDVKGDEIPPEVWQEFNAGKSLVDAYAKVHIKKLQEQIEALKKGTQTAEVNSKNAASTTGSITGEGAEEGLYTEEQVDSMSSAEVKKNYDRVLKSMRSWKRK